MPHLGLIIFTALGGDAAADIAVLRTQPGMFGPAATDPTVSRLIARLATDADDAIADTAPRAAARARVWSIIAGAPVNGVAWR